MLFTEWLATATLDDVCGLLIVVVLVGTMIDRLICKGLGVSSGS